MSQLNPTTSNETTTSLSIHDLEWNKKKQDMIINLGLNSHPETDQTPTPTRFIRNCEQVGLFQDLQNVNPFDEEFKKAIDNPSGVTQLAIAVPLEETTLHTPKILCQVEETTTKYLRDNVSPPNEYSFTSVVPTVAPEDKDEASPLIIALDDDEVKETEAKNDLIAPMKKLLQDKSDKNNGTVKDDLLRQREANKAAQFRCRKKKKEEMETLRFQNKQLKLENSRLHHINSYLEETVKSLQEELKEAQRLARLEGSTIISKTVFKPPLLSNNSLSSTLAKAVPAPLPSVPKLATPLNSGAIGISLPNNANTIVLVCPQPPLITSQAVSTQNRGIISMNSNRKVVTEKLRKKICSK